MPDIRSLIDLQIDQRDYSLGKLPHLLYKNESGGPVNKIKVCSVILAAGDSTRMGFPKALLPLGHGTFLGTILSRHRRAGLDPLVVLGSDHSQIRRRIDAGSFRSLHNPFPEQGPLSSVKIALPHIYDSSAFIMHPVDHPTVSVGTLESLASEHLQNRGCIILPRYLGKKGHPVLFPYRFYADLSDAPLSEGARFVVRNNRSSVLCVDVDDPGILINVDTPERYVELFGFPGLTSPDAGRPELDKALRIFRQLEKDLPRYR